MINKKFYSWYNTEDTDSMGYVDLCVYDIKESARALDELKRVQKTGKHIDEAEGWKGYHINILLENILYLFDRFDITIEDLQKRKDKMEELQ